jgi:uncharacterized RDD family membrane protein YckC
MYPYNFFTLAILFDDTTNYGGGEPIARRTLAFFIDVYAIFSFFWLINLIPIDTIVGKWESDIFAFLASPLIIIFFAALESSNFRASPGKLLVGLVSVNNEGMKLSFTRSLVRNLIKWLPFFITPISYFIFRVEIFNNMAGFWFILTCVTVFFGWFTAHDWFIDSTVNRRPSLLKPYHNAHDIINN